ncbi:MAG TPA: hypothetical protein VFV43_09110 [Limnobacter sp.]|nr:hypothetical protein [Limnobacter sp.]
MTKQVRLRRGTTDQVDAFTGAVGEIVIDTTRFEVRVQNGVAGGLRVPRFGGDYTSLNLAYTGTLTGGTGVINIGSGQLVKDAAGNVIVGNTVAQNGAGFAKTLNIFDNGSANLSVGNATRHYQIGVSGSSLRIIDGTANLDRLTIDSAGNAGLGVTPKAWNTGLRAIQVGYSASIDSPTSVANTRWSNNAFVDSGGGFKYINNGVAQVYEQDNNGKHIWYTAPSGTAGNPITFTQAMTLDQNNNLLLNSTLGSGSRLQISTPGTWFVFRSTTTANNYGTLQNTDGTTLGLIGGGAGAAISGGAANDFVVRAESNLLMAIGNTEAARITSAGNLRPGADNAYSLGESAFRWSVVFAATGTINTSDERSKLDFGPTLGLSFINALEPTSYRYKVGKTVIDQVEDGTEEVPAVLDEQGNEVTPATTRPKYKSVERQVEGSRRHHGLKAQQVKAVLDQFGVDFAGWVLDDPQNPDSQQGLRYDQFIAPLIKAVQEQQSQIEALTARIAALESN